MNPPPGRPRLPVRETFRSLRLTGLLTRRPRLARASLFAAAFTLAPAPPAPNALLPRDSAALASALAQTRFELRAAIESWTPKSATPPRDVVLYALYEQRIYRLLARDKKLADTTLPLLSPGMRSATRDLLLAHRELYRLTPPLRSNVIRVGRAPPAATLLGYYRTAERRFHVPWNVLASVNFVESKFGKLRNTSAAGAQGPMQFLPATWRLYGLGGNVHDPHDAILGAANYLHASGAPRDLRRALHAYNPSSAYVDAVLRYARRMSADRSMYYDLYNWQVFVKTPHGDRRVTGPGGLP